MVRQGQTPFGTVELDDLDRRIVFQLRDNARRSYADIARTVGVSEPTIRNRVDRLIRTGAILPKTRVNPEVLGFSVDAMIGIRVDRGRMPEVGARLAEMEHVSYVAYTTGTFDILIEAYFQDKTDLYDFLNGPLATVEGINYTETWHVLRIEKYNSEWEGENVGRPPLEGLRPAEPAATAEDPAGSPAADPGNGSSPPAGGVSRRKSARAAAEKA